MGAGRQQLPILYQRCYIYVMGWGGEGISGAIEVEMPPRPANIPLAQSFLILCSHSFSFPFLFLWMGTHVNFFFLTVLFNMEGESARLQPAPSRPLSTGFWVCRSLTCPSSETLPLLQLCPILPTSPLACPASGFQSTTSQSTKQFFPIGWEEAREEMRLCTYFVCV